MKRFLLPLLLVSLILSGVSSAWAVTITFNDLALESTNPKIGPLQFSAGDPSSFRDTMVADYLSPGKPYLMSGVDDGSGLGWGLNSYFLAASLDGGKFKSVTVDLAAEEQLPGSPVEFYYFFGKTGVRSGSTLYVTDTAYHKVSLINPGDYDYFGIMSLNFWDKNANYSAFHIDEFTYTTDSRELPEPSTFILLGMGMAGCVIWRRKRA